MTLEDQVAAIAADVSAIKVDVEAIKATGGTTVDLSGVNTKLDSILAQFAATPAPAPESAPAPEAQTA